MGEAQASIRETELYLACLPRCQNYAQEFIQSFQRQSVNPLG